MKSCNGDQGDSSVNNCGMCKSNSCEEVIEI